MTDAKRHRNPFSLSLGITAVVGLVGGSILRGTASVNETSVIPGTVVGILGFVALLAWLIVKAVEWRSTRANEPEGAESAPPPPKSFRLWVIAVAAGTAVLAVVLFVSAGIRQAAINADDFILTVGDTAQSEVNRTYVFGTLFAIATVILIAVFLRIRAKQAL